LVVSIVVVGVLVFAGCGSSSKPKTTSGVAGPSEVALEKTSTPGANPFTAPVGKDAASVKPPPAVANASSTNFEGNLPGLYGGTRNYATCDTVALVTFLESNPSKAAAWARVLSIQPSEIKSYVSSLTPVILRTDTRVTNHGFVNGVANPIPALLEAGTAVLVDHYGVPVVKCYCGNPLTVPLPLSSPTYTGEPWRGFQPGHITIINQSTTIIDTFNLYDPKTGTTFTRPAGSSGTHDGPYQQSPSGTTTGAQPPPTQPAPPPTQATPQPPPQTTPQAPTENPSASFSPSAGHVGDSFTLSASGFAPNTTLPVTLTRPDGVTEHYSISTGGDGSGSYTFPRTGSRTPLGTYTAVVQNPATGAQAQASASVS
jgi:hypothetical protein